MQSLSLHLRESEKKEEICSEKLTDDSDDDTDRYPVNESSDVLGIDEISFAAPIYGTKFPIAAFFQNSSKDQSKISFFFPGKYTNITI